MSLKSFFSRRSRVLPPFSRYLSNPLEEIRIASATDYGSGVAAVSRTQIGWTETPDAHIFKADFLGLRKEEVKIEVQQGRILQISRDCSKEEENQDDKFNCVERAPGKLMRRFCLPENVKVGGLKASMEAGVLTVTVPKHPPVKTIEISP